MHSPPRFCASPKGVPAAPPSPAQRARPRHEWCEDERDMSWLALSTDSPPDARRRAAGSPSRPKRSPPRGLGVVCKDILDDLDPSRRAAAMAQGAPPHMDPAFDDCAAYYARQELRAWGAPDAEDGGEEGTGSDSEEQPPVPPSAQAQAQAHEQRQQQQGEDTQAAAAAAALPRKHRWQPYI